MIVLLPVYMEFVGTPHGFWTAPLVLVYTLAIGLLMVSRVPTWSGKLVGRRIPRDLVAAVLRRRVLIVALLVTFPWETLTPFASPISLRYPSAGTPSTAATRPTGSASRESRRDE